MVRPTPPCVPAVPAVPAFIVMSSPVTSMLGAPSASRMRCDELSVTSPAVEWMWPTSMSPTSSVAVMSPSVVRKICGVPSGGVAVVQAASVLTTKVTRLSVTSDATTKFFALVPVSSVVLLVLASPKAASVVTWLMSMSSPARTSVKT